MGPRSLRTYLGRACGARGRVLTHSPLCGRCIGQVGINRESGLFGREWERGCSCPYCSAGSRRPQIRLYGTWVPNSWARTGPRRVRLYRATQQREAASFAGLKRFPVVRTRIAGEGGRHHLILRPDPPTNATALCCPSQGIFGFKAHLELIDSMQLVHPSKMPSR
jgi:hypothetical protein